MTADEALLAIQELMDGAEWTPTTLDEIAQILIKAGYRVRDLADVDHTEAAKPSSHRRRSR